MPDASPDARPTVSVIVPAFGAAPYLADALESLQAQSFRDWEALVVDDGDSCIAPAAAPFLSDPRIRLLETAHGGASAARNRGIAAARAPYLAMLDADDRYRPDYLTRMLDALTQDERIGFVTSDAILFGIPRFEGKLFSDLEPQSGPITLERVVRRQFKVFGAATTRRAAVERVGGYDERLRSAEDLDLWIRLLAAGWRGARVDAPLVEYRRHAQSLSADALGLRRSDVQMYEKTALLLAERPEAKAARDMVAHARRRLLGEEGFAHIRQGCYRKAVPLLDAAGFKNRSLKWRLALPLMRRFPALAKPILLFYMRRQIFPDPSATGTFVPPSSIRRSNMAISVGDRIPSLTLVKATADGPEPVDTDSYFAGRTVALFSVPGAFTPTCSARHLPSFVEKADELKSKGVDEIACTAVNDAFVMSAWGQSAGVADKVTMLADGNGEFAQALGLTMDGSKFGMGTRGQRWSAVVNDGVVEQLNVEEPGGYNVSSAEHMLGQL